MRYGPPNMTDMMGIGHYVSETRRGPDGQLYQWVEGVDGLGNPIGFFKKLVSKALPLAKMIPGVGPIIGAVKPFCQTLPQMQPFIQQAPGIQPIYTLGNKICKVLGKVGIAGAEGSIMEAPDGQLYEVVEGIGADGTVRRSVRRVWLSIPATIRPRRVRQGVRPVVPAASTVPAMRPAVPVQRMAPALMARPMPRMAPTPMARPVHRFR
ncbi:MAG TPA: hypothetical protein VIG57_13420 [Candidatus Entotheonella sp.]